MVDVYAGPLGAMPEQQARLQNACNATAVIGVAAATVAAMGSLPTPAKPTTAVGGAGGPTGTGFLWKVVFVDANGGRSNAGVVSTPAINLTNQLGSLSAIPIGASGSGVVKREIYRNKSAGTVFFLAGTISDNTTVTYNDTALDSALVTALPDDPPAQPTLFYGIDVDVPASIHGIIVVYDSNDPATGNIIWKADATAPTTGIHYTFNPAVPIICKNGLSISVTGAAVTAVMYWS